jgi:uncharacterized protein (TIGR02246 family)
MLASLVVLACGYGPPALARPLDERALEQWLARYERAWEQRDAAAAAALFTEGATYQEMPFDEPKLGHDGIRNYWTEVTADQRDIDFTSEVVAVDGQVGVARWHATFTLASSGTRLELDGIFELDFDDEGSCTSLREWWHSR